MTRMEQDCEALVCTIRAAMTLSDRDEAIVRKAFLLGYERGCRPNADFLGAIARAEEIFSATFRNATATIYDESHRIGADAKGKTEYIRKIIRKKEGK